MGLGLAVAIFIPLCRYLLLFEFIFHSIIFESISMLLFDLQEFEHFNISHILLWASVYDACPSIRACLFYVRVRYIHAYICRRFVVFRYVRGLISHALYGILTKHSFVNSSKTFFFFFGWKICSIIHIRITYKNTHMVHVFFSQKLYIHCNPNFTNINKELEKITPCYCFDTMAIDGLFEW